MSCYTMQHGKGLWDYAKKNYVDNGKITDFRDLLFKLSDDVKQASGKDIPPDEIAKLLSMPKSVKTMRDKLLLTDYNRRQTLNSARTFVAGQQSPLMRGVKTAYELPYVAKVLGHGPALHMTHAWPYAFDPKMWGTFTKTLVNSWKAMKPSNARALAESIMLDPRFDQKVNSGLAVDPRRIYDDVNRRSNFWGKLGELTSNSFVGLKELRSKSWDALYDHVPDHLRTTEMEKMISNHVNHMTGASPEVSVPEGVRAAMFAPSLDIARIKRVTDFGKSVANAWNKSDPETKFMARENMKQWARVAAVYSGALFLNQMVLKHLFHSNEDVNPKDPFKGDWLAAKGPNGRVFQVTGGEIPMIRAVTKAIMKPNEAGSAIGDYLMGKLNPALQIAKGAITGKTFGHEDLPYPLGKKPASIGNWIEYATAELGPIATEDGIKEFANRMSEQNGIPNSENQKFLNAFWRAGAVTIPAAMGTHSYQPTPPKSHRKTVSFGP